MLYLLWQLCLFHEKCFVNNTLIMGLLYLIQVDTQLHLILVSHFT